MKEAIAVLCSNPLSRKPNKASPPCKTASVLDADSQSIEQANAKTYAGFPRSRTHSARTHGHWKRNCGTALRAEGLRDQNHKACLPVTEAALHLAWHFYGGQVQGLCWHYRQNNQVMYPPISSKVDINLYVQEWEFCVAKWSNILPLFTILSSWFPVFPWGQLKESLDLLHRDIKSVMKSWEGFQEFYT